MRHVMRRMATVVAAVFALTACAAWTVRHNPCDATVHGACIIYAQGSHPTSSTRLRAAFDVAARYWQSDVRALSGWVVVVYGPDVLMGGRVWGATWPLYERLDFATPMPSCPELVFVHEWGHACAPDLGYRQHDPTGNDDPRFDDEKILAALAALPGCAP